MRVRRYRGIFGTGAIFGRRANLGARASPLELEMLNIGIGCSGSGVMSVLLKLVAETSTTATTPACHAVLCHPLATRTRAPEIARARAVPAPDGPAASFPVSSPRAPAPAVTRREYPRVVPATNARSGLQFSVSHASQRSTWRWQ